MPDEILVIRDYPASTGSLVPSLKESFPGHTVRLIDTADLHAGILDRPRVAMLVLPGIVGEKSPYPLTIGEEGLKRIHAFASSRGVVLTICAATYFVCRETTYTPPWGAPTRPPLEAEHFIKPEPGLLVLFPSYMWHGTVPFSGEETRLTMAFDIVPGR